VDIKAICPWNPDNVGLDERKAAAQAYYNSIATLYASWGVDFVKADCLASKPYSGSDIRMLSNAPNLWRISNDVWDLWNGIGDYPKGLADIFSLAAMWAPEARNGAWPDADMLAIGYLGPAPGWGVARNSRLSAAEQHTLLTLWCVSRSPLMIGANLTRLDSRTRQLLTNPEVLKVDQHSGSARLAYVDGNLDVWLATPDDGTGNYLAAFNLGETAQSLDIAWPRLGIRTPFASVRDLWLRKDLGRKRQLHVGLAAHASALYRIAPLQPGSREAGVEKLLY
jgi:hypothetical protein